MIKNYWKQLLVGTYVIVVLFLSATARATSEANFELNFNRSPQNSINTIDSVSDQIYFNSRSYLFVTGVKLQR